MLPAVIVHPQKLPITEIFTHAALQVDPSVRSHRRNHANFFLGSRKGSAERIPYGSTERQRKYNLIKTAVARLTTTSKEMAEYIRAAMEPIFCDRSMYEHDKHDDYRKDPHPKSCALPCALHQPPTEQQCYRCLNRKFGNGRQEQTCRLVAHSWLPVMQNRDD